MKIIETYLTNISSFVNLPFKEKTSAVMNPFCSSEILSYVFKHSPNPILKAHSILNEHFPEDELQDLMKTHMVSTRTDLFKKMYPKKNRR